MDKNKQQTVGPGLYLVSTPIGNMEDITLRALNILKKSDIILCEDTRRSGQLLSYFQIKSKLLPYHKFNEKKVSNKVIDSIKKDKIVSLISDAGTPAISDPGMILVNKCIDENLNVYPIPGPSAVTAALSISGLPTDHFFFEGFLPKKKGRQTRFQFLSSLEASVVVYESPMRIIKTLNDDIFVCLHGNEGMATAGMGDCLSGIILSCIGLVKNNADAVLFATAIHSLSGDLVAEKKGTIGLLATDVIKKCSTLLNLNKN